MTWRGSTTLSDRIFASLPYLLPLVDSLIFGMFLLRQFPPLIALFIPLQPLIALNNTPFVGFIIFLALFMLVVRNERISHFIRFNTMQAILLDIVLILCRLVFPILANPLGNDGLVVETLSNVVFLGVLAAVAYSVVQTLMGRYAEIPTLSEAVYMQVR